MRVPWAARRSNQSVIKEINPEYSLEELMLKLKCQYFGHLMQRVDSLEKTLMLGGTGGRRSGLTRKFETSHVGGATGRTPPIPRSALEKDPRPGPPGGKETTPSSTTLTKPPWWPPPPGPWAFRLPAAGDCSSDSSPRRGRHWVSTYVRIITKPFPQGV